MAGGESFRGNDSAANGSCLLKFSVSHGDKNHHIDLFTVGKDDPIPDVDLFSNEDLIQSTPWLMDYAAKTVQPQRLLRQHLSRVHHKP